MKFICLICIFWLAGCQRQAVPVIRSRNAPLPQKLESVYPPRETVKADTLSGKIIFANRCGRCHGLPVPGQFNREKWDDVLPLMFPRAGLNNEEALHVRTWVLANASKPRTLNP